MPDIAGKNKLRKEDLVTSISSLDKSKEKFRETKSKNIKDCLSSSIRKCTLPCILLHWDEKQLTGDRQVNKCKTFIAV